MCRRAWVRFRYGDSPPPPSPWLFDRFAMIYRCVCLNSAQGGRERSWRGEAAELAPTGALPPLSGQWSLIHLASSTTNKLMQIVFHCCFRRIAAPCFRTGSGRSSAHKTAVTPHPTALAVAAATTGPCRRLPAGISHRTAAGAACTSAACHSALHCTSTIGGSSSATATADKPDVSQPSPGSCCCCCG